MRRAASARNSVENPYEVPTSTSVCALSATMRSTHQLRDVFADGQQQLVADLHHVRLHCQRTLVGVFSGKPFAVFLST